MPPPRHATAARASAPVGRLSPLGARHGARVPLITPRSPAPRLCAARPLCFQRAAFWAAGPRRPSRFGPRLRAVAVAKVRSVETVILLCFRLKQAVGSYALTGGSGFEHLDAMQVAKFAEGESFVLM